MQQIIKYQQNSKGLYDVVITNVEIPEQAIDLLNLGKPIDVDCSVIIKILSLASNIELIFALCNDIEAYRTT